MTDSTISSDACCQLTPRICTQTLPRSSHRSISSLTTLSAAWLPGAYLTQAYISLVQADTMLNESTAKGNRGWLEPSDPPSINPTHACRAPSIRLGCRT